jgi:molecular chaperone GrpE (heat shock protein)
MQHLEEEPGQHQSDRQDGGNDAESRVHGAGQLSEISLLSTRMQAVEEQIAEFNRRSAHREAVIDRLHQENQELRGGLGRTVLEPVVVDLLRFYDTLREEAARLAETDGRTGRVVQGLVEDVTLVLDRCGLEIFTAVPGEPFKVGRHVAAEVVRTDQPELDNTIAEMMAAGFQERDTGRVRRPLRARFYRFDPTASEGRGGPAEDRADGSPDRPPATLS